MDGHMKQEGKLDRCHLKGQTGDQIHALLVAIGHNFRVILRKLRLFYAFILAWIESLQWLNERENDRLNAVGRKACIVQG